MRRRRNLDPQVLLLACVYALGTAKVDWLADIHRAYNDLAQRAEGRASGCAKEPRVSGHRRTAPPLRPPLAPGNDHPISSGPTPSGDSALLINIVLVRFIAIANTPLREMAHGRPIWAAPVDCRSVPRHEGMDRGAKNHVHELVGEYDRNFVGG